MNDEKMQPIPRHGNLGDVACLLVERLKDGVPGDVISDAALGPVCGRDTAPGGNGYPALMSAIRHCWKIFGVRWKRISGRDAIQCLSPSERAEEAESDVRAMRRKARRSRERLATIPTDQLTDQERGKLLARVCQIGTIELMTSPAAAKKIEAQNAEAIPNLKDVLRLFESG